MKISKGSIILIKINLAIYTIGIILHIIAMIMFRPQRYDGYLIGMAGWGVIAIGLVFTTIMVLGYILNFIIKRISFRL